MAILDVVHGVGPADTELAAREVRDEGPPRNSHPRERVGRHCHDLEKALQMVSMLQMHFGCPPRPAINIHQHIIKMLYLQKANLNTELVSLCQPLSEEQVR